MSGVFGSGTHSCADSCLYINWTLLNPERLSVPKKSDRHCSATRLRSAGNGTDAGALQTAPPTASPPASFLHIVLLCLHLSFSLGFSLFLLLPARLLPGAQLALSCLIAWKQTGRCGGGGDAETATAQCIMHYTSVCVCFRDEIRACSFWLKEVSKYNQYGRCEKRGWKSERRIMRHLAQRCSASGTKESALNFWHNAACIHYYTTVTHVHTSGVCSVGRLERNCAV